MPLLAQVKKRLTASMKARNTVETGVLRVLLSKLQVIEAATGPASDEQVISTVKSLIKQNEEEIEAHRGNVKLPDGTVKHVEVNAAEHDADIQRLTAEVDALKGFLPNFLSADQIKSVLTMPGNLEQLKACKNDGAATGVAMKILKAHGPVEGSTVRQVVKEVFSNGQ
jgi:uncharacterized protein YqeY